MKPGAQCGHFATTRLNSEVDYFTGRPSVIRTGMQGAGEGAEMREIRQRRPTLEKSVKRREWRRPELRRLPIAATANCEASGKPVVEGNEGDGAGKGDCGVIS